MKVSIILLRCDFNGELFDLTKAAMATLKADENILIDNGSTFGEVEPYWADITVKNRTNLGYCKAVNQGFKLATGDLLAVANNDILVSPNAIETAKEIFEQNPKVGSVHFRMLPYNTPFWYGFDTWVGGKERWCHASFYIIKREAIPSGGYFEGYSLGGFDDYDLFHRMRDLNEWKQAYTNKAAFRHKDSSTYLALDKRDADRAERDMQNRELYKQRHGEYPDVQFAQLFPEQMQVSWKPFP